MFAEFETLQSLRRQSAILDRLTGGADAELSLQAALRREFPEDVVRAALSLQELRRRAAKKFARAGQMWFDRTGLEQATAEAVARHKARRFDGLVWDYCCGIGGDALALAERCRVIAVDADPADCLRTRWNAEAYGVPDRVQPVCAAVETLPSRAGLLHIDPDRRAGGAGRSIRLEDSAPSLDVLQSLTREFAGGAIKVSPASNFGGKFPRAEVELVSLEGECKEATIWFGRLSTPGLWRATVLPQNETLAGDPLESFAEVAPLGTYLYDPDPSVVRSGLVNLLCEQSGLSRLDEAEEYLTSETFIASPFVRGFEVLAELPNNDREIRRWFREADVGQVEIKCRHIPVQADAVRRKLPLEGTGAAVLVFARLAGRSRAIVCRRLGESGTPHSK